MINLRIKCFFYTITITKANLLYFFMIRLFINSHIIIVFFILTSIFIIKIF
jgi:hypothetical protein